MIPSPVESSGFRESGGEEARPPRTEEKPRIGKYGSRLDDLSRRTYAEATDRTPYDILLFAAVFVGVVFRRAGEKLTAERADKLTSEAG